MIKRTLYFGNPAYLKTTTEQMVIEMQETGETKTVPIEDIGLLILDHQQITITQALMAKLLAYNVALINCDTTHHPVGLLLNLDGNTLQSQKFQAQVEASVPLKKQLWQQTVTAKIQNQAAVLKQQDKEAHFLFNLSKSVSSGDGGHNEAKAAAYYWKKLFTEIPEFRRDRYGFPPNNLLNYGYAILRALMARSLVGSGLLPTLGIFHRNQYNAYCLADDIMEPYRPFVDSAVCRIIEKHEDWWELNTEKKKSLLSIPAMDVVID
jgi:CRISP-associated protein Cas1